MPILSAFTPCGLFALSGAPSRAENIYRAMREATTGEENYAAGGIADARTYATAMALARAQCTVDRAAAQLDPRTATDLLPALERDYRLQVATDATLAQRRARLFARWSLPAGGTLLNIRNALAAELGADFVEYRPETQSAAVATPFPGSANYRAAAGPRGFGRIVDYVSKLGAQIHVAFTLDGGDPLVVGDSLVVQPENEALTETVTVEDLDGDQLYSTFTKTHDEGCAFTTAPYPFWLSTKRTALVLLTAAAAIDPEKRRRVHDVMRRMARGVSTWAIVGETAAKVSGPFLLGSSPLGAASLGSVTY